MGGRAVIDSEASSSSSFSMICEGILGLSSFLNFDFDVFFFNGES